MSKKKKGFTRRELIKHFGAASGLALPLLNSSLASAQVGGRRPTRLLLVAMQHGFGYDERYGRITGTESDFNLPDILTPFNEIKDHCVFLDGLRGTAGGNAHDRSYSDIFTAAVAHGEDNSPNISGPFPEPMGPSLDWFLANRLGENVLRLNNGYGSFGKAYHPLCFNDTFQEQSFYTTALEAYNAFIRPLESSGGGGSPVDQSLETNLFSLLGKDADRLVAAVPTEQEPKVRNYLQALENLRSRIINPNSGGGSTVTVPPPPGVNLSRVQTLDQFLDFYKLVFQANTHRIGVLGVPSGSEPNFPWVDGNNVSRQGQSFGGYHHEIAHHADKEPNRRRAYSGNTKFFSQKLVDFAKELATIPDGDGFSLLDNTLIVLTGEVSNGSHQRGQKLHILIGGGGGHVTTGRWRQFPVYTNQSEDMRYETRDGRALNNIQTYGTPYSSYHHADLFVAISKMMGVDINSFGLGANNTQVINL